MAGWRILQIEVPTKYTQEQVDAMFQALEGRVAEIKARFTPKKTAESKTFSFGTTE